MINIKNLIKFYKNGCYIDFLLKNFIFKFNKIFFNKINILINEKYFIEIIIFKLIKIKNILNIYNYLKQINILTLLSFNFNILFYIIILVFLYVL